MTDYTKLTEQEINEAVAELIISNRKATKFNNVRNALLRKRAKSKEFNPCNNAENWERLLEELRELGVVSIWANSVHFNADAGGTLTGDIQESKLGKAICILWLMVKGE